MTTNSSICILLLSVFMVGFTKMINTQCTQLDCDPNQQQASQGISKLNNKYKKVFYYIFNLKIYIKL